MLICLDFGGSSIKYGLLDDARLYSEPQNAIMEKDQVPNTFEDQETFLSAVYDLIQKLRDRYPVSGIAISYCGELDHAKGIIHSPGSYRFNGGFHMREALEAETGLPVAVENDGNAAMLAEWNFGSLKGYENAAMLVLGTGIAGSFVLDGALHTGKMGFSGILSMCPNDLTRPIGFENAAIATIASHFLMREYLTRIGKMEAEDMQMGRYLLDGKPFTGKDFFERLHASDPVARAVLETYAGNISRFLLTLQCVLEVEVVAFGGGITAQDSLIDAIQAAVDALYRDPLMETIRLPKPRVLRAGFGSDANLVGAALWFHELFQK